jgi:predicted nuclease with TOPRIM domain
MCCEQLAKRIKDLTHKIDVKEEKLEELEKQPSTLQLIEFIKNLRNEVDNMKQELNGLLIQFKKNKCR